MFVNCVTNAVFVKGRRGGGSKAGTDDERKACVIRGRRANNMAQLSSAGDQLENEESSGAYARMTLVTSYLSTPPAFGSALALCVWHTSVAYKP